MGEERQSRIIKEKENIKRENYVDDEKLNGTEKRTRVKGEKNAEIRCEKKREKFDSEEKEQKFEKKLKIEE